MRPMMVMAVTDLAGAGLTDDAQGLATIERVGDTVDSANDAIRYGNTS